MWRLIVRCPDGEVHVYPAGDGDADAVQAAVDRARADLDIPDGWPDAGWDLAASPGGPHPTLLATATVHK